MTATEIDLPTTAPEPGSIPLATAQLDSLGHAVIGTDLGGVVEYWNAAAERLYGWTRSEAMGRELTALTPTRTGDSSGAETVRALRAGGTCSGASTVRRRDGRPVTALVTDSVVRDRDGEPVGTVRVSVGLDRAVQPLLDRSSDATLVVTAPGHISYLSPAASRLFGWAPQDLVGTPIGDIVHPDDRATILDHHRLLGVDPAVAQVLECRLHDDARRWVEITMTAVLGDPDLHGLVCTLRDVTSRRNEHDQLVRLTGQLQTALSSRILIERATGHTAGRTGADLQAAFTAMRNHARVNNRRLREVAGEVLSGTLRLTP